MQATAVERLAELRLFGGEEARGERCAVAEVGVCALHALDDGFGDAIEHRLARRLELCEEVDSAPKDAAQHIAAAFVRRRHAIGDEERRRAGVLGDDAHGDVGRGILSVGAAGQLFDAGEDGAEDIRLVDGVFVLQYRGDALEAGAGVDVLARQLGPVSVLVLVQRHEDEVPDLEEAAAVRLEVRLARAVAAVGARLARAAVDEDLAVGAAGANAVPVTGRPVVVLLAVAVDAVLRNADAAPEVVRLVVIEVDRDPELVAVELEDRREQLPRPLDGLLFEVVADAEVAEHLEHRQVAVVADFIDVRGAEDLLHGDHARRGRLGEPHEVRLERHHAGAREEQRRVAVRHEGGARHAQMAALDHEAHEGVADVVDVHRAHCREVAIGRLSGNALG